MKKEQHILLVEDDKNMGFLLRDSLEMTGYTVTHCADGKSAFDSYHTANYDLCILDVMMPVMDGFMLAAEIRKTDKETPIIFLTARAVKEDRITGFKLGADDYVTKPFSIEELTLRIAAILRRRGADLDPLRSKIHFSTYTLYLTDLSLDMGGHKVSLTQKEADLLAYFLSKPNILIQREDILQSVWKSDNYFVGRSLDVFISRLRKIFKADGKIEIVNVHGAGFRFMLD